MTKPTKTNQGLAGQNAPEQQYAIRDIMFYIYDEKKIKSIPELKIFVNEVNYKIPDIVTYVHRENGEYVGVIYFEVCRKSGIYNDTEKLQSLQKNQKKGKVECFIYEYESNIWYKVNKKGRTKDESRSELLGLDFKLAFTTTN